jgi:hypothetical protein
MAYYDYLISISWIKILLIKLSSCDTCAPTQKLFHTFPSIFDGLCVDTDFAVSHDSILLSHEVLLVYNHMMVVSVVSKLLIRAPAIRAKYRCLSGSIPI